MVQLLELCRSHPLLRVAVSAMLTCWVVAGLLAIGDALNLITVPDHR